MSGSSAARVQWQVGERSARLGEGAPVVGWEELRGGWIAEVRTAGMRRGGLDSPARPWLAWLEQTDELAVVDVVLDDAAAAADLLGFVVEPALRLGIELEIVADRRLEDCDSEAFFEAQFGYAHALERLRFVVRGSPPRRVTPPTLADGAFAPDDAQRRAVLAGGGVVQIIAPAGSGKTAVLVERVRELRRRGVPAKAIVCVTFNKAAKVELAERLTAAGVGDVGALTFHGLGWRVLRDAKALRDKVDGPTLAQWRLLAAQAKRAAGDDGVWLDPGDAKSRLADIKLGLLQTPEQYAAATPPDADGERRTLAALYTAYEELQRASDRLDLDDLVAGALALLRERADVRARWQGRWECVLVDEYQDIEPAQELLVRIVAAPHDQLFCVGDEDQTLYAFRRASVERIMLLDKLYPALERIALETNYRCPGTVVAAAARLIAHNTVRFTKTIVPAPDCEHDGEIVLRAVARRIDGAAAVARTLAAHERGEIVVLARTSNALRPIALACADAGVAIDGPAKLFAATGARRALGQHLALAGDPQRADDALVRAVCQTPGRGVRQGAEATIARALREGRGFDEAFADIPAPRRGGGTLLAPGELFERLAECANATAAVALLRGPGGLEDWFSQGDAAGGPDDFEAEVLEQAGEEAHGLTVGAYLEQLRRQARALAAIRDEDGVELATIHGAKGRQWPHVVVFACDDGTLPHARAIAVDAEAQARGEGIEAERRLAYVAFTRAGRRLELYHDPGRPSPFLDEAGLVDAPERRRAKRTAPPVPRPPRAPRPPRSARRAASAPYLDAIAIARAAEQGDPAAAPRRDGPPRPAPAVASVPDPVAERRRATGVLVDQRSMAQHMTVGRLARELALSTEEVEAVLQRIGAGKRTRLRRLDDAQTRLLAQIIRGLG